MAGMWAFLIALLFATTPAFAGELESRLFSAASEGDLEGVKAALQDGADVDYAPNGVSVLHVAAMDGHAEVVSALLARGANVNIADSFGNTPLYQAIFWNKKSVVEILLANGADVRRLDKRGETPLHWVARQGNPDVAKLLLERSADVNALSGKKDTPLDLAQNASMADFLLSRGARIGGISSNGKTLLAQIDRELFSAAVAGNAERVRSAVSRGAHVNIRDSLGDSPLMRAVYLGRSEAAQALLDKGADIGETNFDGQSALHVAAGQGHARVAGLLLAHGASVNARNSDRQTPLQLALNAETALVLLRAGADATIPDKLCDSSRAGDRKLVELLLSYGADANPKTKCIGDTPLLTAISYKNWEIVSILLDHGADPNATGGSDSTPLTLAAGLPESANVVARLLERGANPNTPNKDGDTALIEAVRYGRTDVVELLLNRGANIGAKDRNGFTALAHAMDIAMADLLVSRGANTDDLVTFALGSDAKLDNRQRTLLKAVVTENVQAIAAVAPSRQEINQPLLQGFTFLHLAATFGRIKIADWLLEHGADANKSNSEGATPLHTVALDPAAPQKIQVMDILVKRGANVDAPDKNGMTPLHIAAGTYNKDAVDFLLGSGADPSRRDKDGRTPMQLAQRSAFGTGLLGMRTSPDVAKKGTTIDALRSAMSKRLVPQ
jgi:ankyrin repeat protein